MYFSFSKVFVFPLLMAVKYFSREENIPSLLQYRNVSVFAVYLQLSGLGCEGIMNDLSRVKT